MTDQAAVPSRLLGVAVPVEHGGWSFTLEPVLLGLLVAPSMAGAALGGAALVAFVLRTPLKLALVDRWRKRRLPRTRLAERVAGVEVVLLTALVAMAAVTAAAPFWVPLLAAAPLVGVELWYDARSRSRRLVPEVAGAVAMGSVAGAVALAGESGGLVAAGLWIVLAARAVAAVSFVRLQLRRAKEQPAPRVAVDAAQAGAVTMVAAGVAVGAVPPAGAVAVGILCLAHVVLIRLRAPSAPFLGAQQLVLGLGVVLATGFGAVGA